MKKLAIAAAVLVLLLSACANPFAHKASKSGAVKSGTVTITFGNKIGAKKLARTIVPDIVASAESFTVTLTSKNGYTAKTAANIAPGVGQAVFVGVEAGTWDVNVTAYMSETTPVASGTYSGLVLGADAAQSATVYLSPNSGSDPGSIDLPVTVAVTTYYTANHIAVSLENPDKSVTNESPDTTLSGTPDSGDISIMSLPPGTYSLIMNIFDHTTSLGTFRESVSVYSDLMSNMWVASNGSLVNGRTFLSSDLLNNNAELSNLVISGEAAGDIPNLIAFDSTITSYDEGTVVKGSAISFTPTRSIDGQKITYNWNGGSAITVVSGSSSGALALASGTNTLVVNVTAPNKVTTNSYTFTMQNVPNYTNSLNMQMVYVTGGTYFMGSDTLVDGSSVLVHQSVPVHQVTVSDFMLGKYPVTQDQYTKVTTGTATGGGSPVVNITRSDAMVFCNALSVEEGLQKVYPEPITATTMPDWTKNGYRLPSDAEYEYAARGGNLSKSYAYPGSNNPDDVAWYNGSVAAIQTVGTKLPNELGLYDMAGNVFEYTEDWIQTYGSSGSLQQYDRTPSVDPLAPYRPYDDNSYIANLSYRSMRGGSISSQAFEVNSAYRENIDPSASSGELGFRVARGVRPLVRMLDIPAGTEPSTGMNLPAFKMSETEITQAQFKKVMGFNPSLTSTLGDDFPVGNVTWYDALSFCNKLSDLEGLQEVYTLSSVVHPTGGYSSDITSATVSADFSKNGYRLPTNSERIWAARGGTTSTYYWGEATDQSTVGGYAWYGANSSGECHSVGHMSPNARGLYDMSGNTWEWGWGSDNVYLQTPQRYGGAYNIPQAAIDALASTRGDLCPGYAGGDQGYWDNGFRVVKGATSSCPTMVAYANDAASNSLIAYSINSSTGAFTQYASYSIPSTGPSGLALAPNMKALYSTWQGSSLIYAHTVDPSTGALTILGTQVTGGSPGPISITPDSKYLYVLNTGENTIYWYSIMTNGNLSPLSSIATGVPYSTAPACAMAINRAGTYLFVGHNNQTDSSNGITVFSIDLSTGTLAQVGSPISTSSLGVDSLAISHDGAYLFICENGGTGVVETATINGDGSLSPSTGNPTASGTAGQTGISLDLQGKFIYIDKTPPNQGLWVGSVSSVDGSVSFSGMYFSDGIGVGCGLFGPLTFDPTGRFAYSPAVDSSNLHYLEAYAKNSSTGYLSIINDTTSDAIKPNAVVVGSLP